VIVKWIDESDRRAGATFLRRAPRERWIHPPSRTATPGRQNATRPQRPLTPREPPAAHHPVAQRRQPMHQTAHPPPNETGASEPLCSLARLRRGARVGHHPTGRVDRRTRTASRQPGTVPPVVRFPGVRAGTWPRTGGRDRQGDDPGHEHARRNAIQRENGVRRARAARHPGAPAGRCPLGRSARGKGESSGRNAAQRENGARRIRAVRYWPAPVGGCAPGRNARGKPASPECNAIQRGTGMHRARAVRRRAGRPVQAWPKCRRQKCRSKMQCRAT
jgi:hypothetical protein